MNAAGCQVSQKLRSNTTGLEIARYGSIFSSFDAHEFEQVLHLDNVTFDAGDFSHADHAAFTVAEALQLVEPLCRHHGITVTWQPPGAAVLLRGDAESLRQMLLNLLINAIEAVQPLVLSERKIGVELDRIVDGVIRLRIWDQGPGPSAEIWRISMERQRRAP